MAKELSQAQLKIYNDVFQVRPSKAQRRMIQILNAAIQNYSTIGIEETTYESIAKACKTSRSLVQHYFKEKDDLFETVMKYIRVNYQQFTIDAFSEKKDPTERLIAYVDSAVAWVKEFPRHQRVWNLFYYYCGIHPKWRKIETDLVNIGHERIIALLQDGAEKGAFAADHLKRRAKQIQVLITGAIVTATTEDLYVSIDDFRGEVVEACLRLATFGMKDS